MPDRRDVRFAANGFLGTCRLTATTYLVRGGIRIVKSKSRHDESWDAVIRGSGDKTQNE